MWHNGARPGSSEGSHGQDQLGKRDRMLLQTNSYIVPKEKRAEHARLMRRFRQVLNRLGCEDFEVYEQVGANWSATQTSGRFVQIMRFRDRKHQLAVQGAERTDPAAQELIAEFCDLVNYPYQQQQGQFAVGFYSSVLPVAPIRAPRKPGEAAPEQAVETDPEAAFFGTPVGETGLPAAAGEGAEAAEFAGVDNAPATNADAATGEAREQLTEAEQEVAADQFAQAAEGGAEGLAGDESAAAAESTEPTADYEELPLEVCEDDLASAGDESALPSLDADAADAAAADAAAEPRPDAHPSAPADAEPGANGAARATPPPLPAKPQASSDEAVASAAHDAPAAENGEFDLVDLDAVGDLEMTDDDLARLAQELSSEPPARGGSGSNGGPGDSANPR